MKKMKKILSFFLLTIIMNNLFAVNQDFTSQLVNQSKQTNNSGYRLLKTRIWPESGCVLDSGKKLINPGESSTLKVKNSLSCSQAGIGYSMYTMDDTKNEHLLGYLSHRFRDGKFSMQVSIFCEGDQCVFRDLNPTQKR